MEKQCSTHILTHTHALCLTQHTPALEMPIKCGHTNPNSYCETPIHCGACKIFNRSRSHFFCGRLFALKISARRRASRHNAHVVVINHNYHGLKKPQLLFDFKNKP